jgi:hypothetical protein
MDKVVTNEPQPVIPISDAPRVVNKAASQGRTASMLLTGAVIALVVVAVYSFLYNGSFTTLKAKNSEIEDLKVNTSEMDVAEIKDLRVIDNLTVPVDASSNPTQGSLRYNSLLSQMEVYDGADWVAIASKDLSTTELGLINTINDPIPNLITFQNTFNGGTILVSDETTFNNATAAANENGIVRLSGNITFSSAVTIPNKRLWIDLNSFTISVPIQTVNSIICQQSSKTIYFANGTIQYTASGTTGSSSSVIGASGCELVMTGLTIIHAEYAATFSGVGTPMTFYSANSTFTFTKVRSSNNNTYAAFLFVGTDQPNSNIFIKTCTFNSLASETYLNSSTERHRMIGVIRVSAAITAGSCTITGCTINPAHRVQTVFYSEVNTYTPTTRGNFKLVLNANTIGDAGDREQLALLIGSNPLNGYSSIWMVENVFQRMDSNKGILYVDGTSGGNTDVYWIDNTIPPMKSVDPIVFLNVPYSRVGNIATITTSTPHGFVTGYVITTAGSTGGLSSGSLIVQSIISPTQFTVQDTVSGDTTGTTTVIDSYATSLRKLVSKDGFVRGPSTITSTYLRRI